MTDSKAGVPARPASASLGGRAFLGAAAGGIQGIARLTAGLIVSPIIMRGLGAELYGAWTMIQQSIGYFALADSRASGTLKFSLAIRQHDLDEQSRRRLIGAAVRVSLWSVPVALLLGGGLVVAIPNLIRTDPNYADQVRWAAACACLAMAVTPLLNLPDNVLRGMNLEYKSALTSTVLVLVGGLVSALAILGGLGIVGLAGAGLLTAVIGGGAYARVARRALPWYGSARPSPAEASVFTRRTGWLFLGSCGQLLLNSSDLLVVGAALGPAAAGRYAVTGAVLRIFGEAVMSLLSPSTTGLAGLCGRQEWRRVEEVRFELHLLALALTTVLGVGVIALNESFLRLWVGPGYYAGHAANIWLVVAAIQGIWLRLDGTLADSLLQFRERAVLSIVGGLLGLLAGAALARLLGLAGMAAGTVAGRLVATIGFPLVVEASSGLSVRTYLVRMSRPIVAGIGLLVGATQVATPLSAVASFVPSVLILGAAVAVVMWTAGFNRRHRDILAARVRALLGAVPAGLMRKWKLK